jgi:hypothetical protein
VKAALFFQSIEKLQGKTEDSGSSGKRHLNGFVVGITIEIFNGCLVLQVKTVGHRHQNSDTSQILTVAKERLEKQIGRLSPATMADVDRDIKLSLDLL